MIKEILSETESKMEKALSVAASEFQRVRTGRASVSLLDRVQVEYYGTKTPLNQLASISVPEAQLIVIQPWDKSCVAEVEKAILASDLGLTPSNDGNIIRLPFPPLTEERRKELVKVIRKIAEEGRVSMRNIRRDANEHLKELEKKGEISEDDFYRNHDKVQEITDSYVSKVEELLKNKEKEIMEV